MNIKFKLIKYIVFFILITVAIIATAELNASVFYNKFHSQPYIMFEAISELKTIDDVKKIADENNITFYAEYDKHKTVIAEEKCIYTNNPTEITGFFNLKSNVLKSIFEGKMIFSIQPVEEMMLDDGEVLFYMLGDDNDIKTFAETIDDNYGLSRKVLRKVENTGIIPVPAVWISVLIMVFLLGIYEVSAQKKEVFLRSVFGEELWKMILYNITIDTGVCILILLIDYIIFHNLISWEYSVSDIGLNMLIVVLANSLLYLSFLKNDSKTIIKDIFSEGLVVFNNFFKFLSIVLAVILITLVLDVNGIMSDYKKIDEFARCYKDYSLCMFQNDDFYYRTGEIIKAKKADEVLNEKIYRNNFEKFKPVVLVQYTQPEADTAIVYSNINAYDYLITQIDGLENEIIEKEICIIMPEKINDIERESIIENVSDIIKITEGPSFRYDYQIFIYKNNARIVSFDDADTDLCNVVSNPVIVYNCVRADTLTTPIEEPSRAGYMHDILYRVDQDDIDEIMNTYSLQKGICQVTNFYEYYSTEYELIKTKAMILYFIVIVVLALETLITTVVVVLNYKIYSVELCMKKVFGYSIIEKNKSILVYNFLCILAAFIISIFIFPQNIKTPLSVCLLLLLAESFITVFQIIKTEKQNINHVIKGK